MKDFHLCVNENLGFDLCRLVTVGKTHFELLCMLVFLVELFHVVCLEWFVLVSQKTVNHFFH